MGKAQYSCVNTRFLCVAKITKVLFCVLVFIVVRIGPATHAYFGTKIQTSFAFARNYATASSKALPQWI